MVFNFDNLKSEIISEFSEFDFQTFCNDPIYYYINSATQLQSSENQAIKNAAKYIYNNKIKIAELFNISLLQAQAGSISSTNKISANKYSFLVAGQHPPKLDESGKHIINIEQKNRVDAVFVKISEILSVDPVAKFIIVATGAKHCNDTGTKPSFEEPQKSIAQFTIDYIYSKLDYKEFIDNGLVELIGESFISEVMPFSVFGSADECNHYAKYFKSTKNLLQKKFISCSAGQAMRYFLLAANNKFVPEFIIPESTEQAHHNMANDLVAISQIFEQMINVDGDSTSTDISKFPFAMGSRLRRATKNDLEKFLNDPDFRKIFLDHMKIIHNIVAGEEIDGYGFYKVFQSKEPSVVNRLNILADLEKSVI